MNIKSMIFNVCFIGIFLFVTGRMVMEYFNGTETEAGHIVGIVLFGFVSVVFVYRFFKDMRKE